VDTNIFFEISQFKEQQDRKAKDKHDSNVYSLRRLLSLPEDEITSFTFTNSVEVAEAKQMDQIQRIIEQQKEENGKEVSFFSIKLLKVDRETKGDEEEPEEVMVQIQDISLRI